MRIVVLLALFLAGCVSTSVTPLSSTPYPATHPDRVVVYLDEADIPGDYEKVALIYAKGDYTLTDEGDLFKKARKKAAKLGANGLLVRTLDDPGTGAKVANFVLGTPANRKSEIIAIYVSPTPTVVTAPAER